MPSETTMAPYNLQPTSLSGPLPNLVGDFEGVMAANYDAKTADVLRFWFFTAREQGWNLTRLAKTTGVSTTTLYRLFRGEYAADAGNAAARLIMARETFRDSAENPDFIDTSLAKRLFTVFDKTRALRNVSIVWGKMGIGKSVCIGEYARRNPGRTSVVRFPAGSTFAYFVQEVGRAVGVAKLQASSQLRERITHILGMGQRLLIVDELHQAFLTTRTDCAVRCCEFLREVSDVSQCGLVLVGTELLEESIFRGPHKDSLRQFVDRGTVQVSLPALATQKDIQQFLQAYGLDFPNASKEPAAHAILEDLIKSAGLRKLTLHLRDGAAYASRRGESNEWKHFTAAFQAIQSLSK
jgi:DNA transposition AAA+ family ATPase